LAMLMRCERKCLVLFLPPTDAKNAPLKSDTDQGGHCNQRA